MLRRDWPSEFNRTITVRHKGKDLRQQMVFSPGVAVDLTPAEIEALRGDIGIALQPVELDDKARPRIITDEVSLDESVNADEPKQAD